MVTQKVQISREAADALRAHKQLQDLLKNVRIAPDAMSEHVGPDAVLIPDAAIQPILEVLERLGRGESPSVVTLEEEVTTQHAADILNVSRPTLVKMIEEGKIPFDRVGRHRRLRLRDVLAYREARSKARMEAFDQLMQEEADLDLPD